MIVVQPASSPTDLVVLVPMLGRAAMLPTLVDSLRDTTPGARLLFLCTTTDPETLSAAALHGDFLAFPANRVGDYAHKINAGVAATTEPWLFFGAIDIEFTDGWFNAALALTDERIRVVGTNDLANPRVIRGEHATHFLVARDYATRPLIDGGDGPLFTGYVHEYVDDEFLGTAKARNAYAFAADSHVRHRHPNFDPSVPWDASYQGMQRRMRRSRKLYQQRRALWT